MESTTSEAAIAQPCSAQPTPNAASTHTKAPVPAAGNPSPEDRFAYTGFCQHTQRDITICYQTIGDPRHQCLLLVCGLGSTLYSYPEEFCQMLADKGFYVVRYDNRDVGLSTHLDGLPTPQLPRMILPSWLSVGEGEPPYFMHQMALDGLNLLTALGIRKAHLLGQSMGGMIIQTMAILQPERVLSQSIVFSHSGGPNVKPQSWGMTFAFLDGPRSRSREDVLAFKLRNMKRFEGGYTMDAVKMSGVINKVLDRNDDDLCGLLRQVWAIQRSLSRDAELQRLKGFPTLILHGVEDTMIPVENGMQLCQLIPGSKLVVFPRMGHWMPPELYKDIIGELCLLREKSEAMLSTPT